MKEDLTPEEKKIIYHAVRYWQIHKSTFDGKDYKICDSILNRWFDDVKLTKENSND
jgi:hypothetical protein